jgi:hypothetical protein
MEVITELTASTLLTANSAVILPTPIPKPKYVQYKKHHGKVDVRGLTGAEIAVRTTNTIEKGGKKATKEVDRESRRAAESQSGTTITVGVLPPLAISIGPDSSPENGRRASTTS